MIKLNYHLTSIFLELLILIEINSDRRLYYESYILFVRKIAITN